MKSLSRGKVAGIIVAAGTGERMGGIDKIFSTLSKFPILAYTLDVFERCSLVDDIIVVVNEEKIESVHSLSQRFGWGKIRTICVGGKLRSDSVYKGLQHAESRNWVIIHDGCRPFVTQEMLSTGLLAADETGASTAAVPIKDTLKLVDENQQVIDTPVRSGLWFAQTPQIFRRELILKAYETFQEKSGFTDDASMIERLGGTVKVFWGTYDNIKITTPEDLDLARIIVLRREIKLDVGP